MMKGLCAGLIAAWVVIGAGAEEPVPDVKLFTLPKVELKQEAVTNGLVASEAAFESSEAPEEFSASVEDGFALSEASVQSYETMNGGAVLSQVARPAELGGAIGWVNERVWEPVFAPEVVKLGKVKVSGGVVAAIKRKNPFCLLNPLVFIASW